jgi:hypothetical protein
MTTAMTHSGGRLGVLRRAAPGLTIVLLAGAARLLYGAGHLGYDAFYSLAWGNDLTHGRLPDFGRALAPTPHPLANLAGAVLSLLGAAAAPAVVAVSALAFGALGYAAYRLGATLFSRPIGVLFAAVLLTRDEIVSGELQAYVDIPYLALVLGAAALEARRPRRGAPVLVLLGLAGLLRPEAWLFSILYAAWLMPTRGGAERVRVAAAGLAAPIIWLTLDLIVTGDPLHSLHGTQSLAETFERPRSLGTALLGGPDYIGSILDDPVVIFGGVAGAALALWLLYERALLPLSMLAAAIASFVGLGVVGLPVLLRYMLLPSAVIALFFAVALLGWMLVPAGTLTRHLWAAAAAIVALLSALTLPSGADRVDKVTMRAERQRAHQTSLSELLGKGPVTRAASRCGKVYVPNHAVIPQVAYSFDRPVGEIVSARVEPPRRGLLVSPATRGVELGTVLDPREPKPFPFAVPRGFSPLASNPNWIVYERC